MIPLCFTQHFEVRIKGKVEQSREKSSAFSYTSAIEKGAFKSPSTTVANFSYLYYAGIRYLRMPEGVPVRNKQRISPLVL